MNHFRALNFLAVAFATSVDASEHTGDWIGRTPIGEDFKCRIVTTEAEMENVLQRAGWYENYNIFPTIDWQKDEAVIVAPDNYYEDASLEFYDLVRKDNHLILFYGWEPILDPEPIIDDDEVQAIVFRSRAPSVAGTIVVSYNRESNADLECCRYRTSLHDGSCALPTRQ